MAQKGSVWPFLYFCRAAVLVAVLLLRWPSIQRRHSDKLGQLFICLSGNNKLSRWYIGLWWLHWGENILCHKMYVNLQNRDSVRRHSQTYIWDYPEIGDLFEHSMDFWKSFAKFAMLISSTNPGWNFLSLDGGGVGHVRVTLSLLDIVVPAIQVWVKR